MWNKFKQLGLQNKYSLIQFFILLLPSVLWHCWLGGIRPVKSGGWWRWALVSLDGVVPSRMVGVSASANLPLHHKVQKFSSGISSPGWSRKKGRKTVVVVYYIITRLIQYLILSVMFAQWSQIQQFWSPTIWLLLNVILRCIFLIRSNLRFNSYIFLTMQYASIL